MSDMNRSFAGQMPEFYDRFLVPVMFAPFAQDLAQRLHGMLSGHLLELAAGTGIVTRALARTLSAAVAITATDLNPAMLTQAKSHAGLERIQWQEADALSLPFADQQFDYIVCQFGVMFFPDKVAAFREALRVLRPDGRFLFSVWGSREGSVWDVVVTVVGQFLSRDPASLISPPYNDVATVQADLAAPGFASITTEDVIQSTRSRSPREAAISQCHGGLVRAAIDAQMPDRLDEITEAAAAAIAARFGSGSIESPLHAILFTAARPGG
jgi:SAM-dependent methyltransferase